jgi:hypothetical protein
MKQYILTQILIFASLILSAQLGTKVKEFNRGRLQIPGSNYGHHYPENNMLLIFCNL